MRRLGEQALLRRIPRLDRLQRWNGGGRLTGDSPKGPTLFLSVVIPIHNEDEILRDTVVKVCSGLEALGIGTFEIILSENGGVGRTREIAFELARQFEYVTVLVNDRPDYGAALRSAMLAARGRLVVNFDADYYDLDFLRRALPRGEDIVIASKGIPGSRDNRTISRRIISRAFGWLTRHLLGLKVRETHGIKLFRRAAVVDLIPQVRSTRDLFDTELVARAEWAGLRITEIPVTIEEIRHPRTGILGRIPRTLLGLIRLQYSTREVGRHKTQQREGPESRWAGRVHPFLDLLVLGIVFGVLLAYFRPGLLFSRATPTGGDWAGHLYAPWYLKTHLLPRGLASGWSPGWYAGLPLYHFYFPLVGLLQALLAFVMPYSLAFKIGALLGTFFLPVAAYLAFRVLRFHFPTPILGAVLTLAFLFMRSFNIYGGNIPSSLAGEYSYSLSLGLSLFFLALAYQAATQWKGHPVLAGVVLASATLCHLVPVITVLTAVPLLAVLGIRKLGWGGTALRLGTILGLGFGLVAFWAVPFAVRLSYSTDLNWHQVRQIGLLAPRELWIYLWMAAGGALVALRRRDPRFLLFLLPAASSVAFFAFMPEGARVFNARFLPFWYLSVILAATYLIGTVTASVMNAVGTWRWRTIGERWRLSLTGVVVVGLAAGVMAPSLLAARRVSYIDDWIRWNLQGYEGKAAWPELRSLFDVVRRLPPGRIMWEPSPEYGKFGSPDALMALPYFAGHPTMEGIYYESSITTDYHFVMASELADRPSNPWPSLPYQPFDVSRGIDHMEMFDVRYLIVWSARTEEAAAASPRLVHLRDIGGFALYALRSSGQVVIPTYHPIILEGGDWNRASLDWFVHPDVSGIPLVRSGPDGWAKVRPSPSGVPRVVLPHGGEVMDATIADDEISFDTRQIGVPHLIRTSFFPNWKAHGARGPYQVSPSLMLVIPTRGHVDLRYERTWAEWLGLGLTSTGLALMLILAGRRILAIRAARR